VTNIPIINTNPAVLPNIGNLMALRYSDYTSQFEICDPGFSDTSVIPHCN
jgi:hypothetical protein